MKKKLLMILILILVTLSIGCNDTKVKDTPTSEISEYQLIFNEGLTFFQSQAYDLAIEKFKSSLELSHKEDTLLYLSKAYYALENYDQANNYIIESVSDTAINTSEEHRIYGDILFALNNHELAFEQYTIASQLDTKNGYAWYGIALYYEYIDNYEEYMQAFKKAASFTKDTSIYVHILDIYISSNDLLSYSDMIVNLYSKYPKDFAIAKHYGNYLDLTYKKDQALDHYNKMAIEFDHPEAIMLVPEYLIKLGRFDTCIKHMSANDPYNQSQAYIELYANTYAGLRQQDKAIKVANKVIQLDENNYFGYYLKGKILYNDYSYLESIELFEKAAELHDAYEVYDYLLLALYNSNRLYKFQDLAYEVLERFGHKTHLYEYLAFSYNLLGQYDEAITIYNELLKTSPTNDDMKYYLAEAYYYSKNDKERALEYLNDYNEQYSFIDLKVTTLKDQITRLESEDVDYVGSIFYYNYIYDVNYSVLDDISGDLSDDDMNDVFNALKDPDDPYSFFIYGDDYSYLSNRESGIEYKDLGNDVHYINIESFTYTLGYEFINIIDEIEEPETSKLVIDLRDNSGGSTDAANMLLDNLIGQATTLKFVYSNDYMEDYSIDNDVDEFYSDASKVDFEHIYILVNNDSASSAEIVTLGLDIFLDNTTIVGEKTFGKGVGQYAYEDSEKERFYYIVSFYWNVGDINIHNVGITPDIIVENDNVNAYMLDLLEVNEF